MLRPMTKNREQANWYVQVTAGAIFRPIETAGEMLRNLDALRERFPEAECGVMVETIERATGKLVALEVYPMQSNGTLQLYPRWISRERSEMLSTFVESLARIQAVRMASAQPITRGAFA